VSTIVAQRPHRLDQATARNLATSLIRRLRAEFGGSYTWAGNTLRYRRPGVSGRVEVTPAALEVRIEIGLVLTPLDTSLEREIQRFFDEHLGELPGRAESPPAGRESGLGRRRPR
jgi:putative polyhydroxyalkanoate system protein